MDGPAQDPWSSGCREGPNYNDRGRPKGISDKPLQSIRVDEPNVYTLRGPRQVGKTTLLKQLASRVIRDGGTDPSRVVYYPLDLVERPTQIVEIVERAKAAYPPG